MQKQRFLATNIRSKELEKEFQGGIIVNLTNRTSQILLFNGLICIAALHEDYKCVFSWKVF